MPSLPVSVIIPVRDREALVGEAIASAFAQQPLAPAEVIVIDDGSMDASAAVAAAAGATVLRHDLPRGIGAARNTGVAAAVHAWVAFLDSDDAWGPNLLDRLWASRAEHVLVSARLLGTDSGRVYGNPTKRAIELREPAAVLAPENVIALSATLVDKAALLAAGGFRDGVIEDLDLWLRVLEHGTGVALAMYGGSYREHPGQVVADRGAMRAGVREVIARFADRPWMTAAIRDRVELVLRWDELRAARWPLRIRTAMWLTSRPRRVRGLVALWRSRYRARHPRGVS